MKKLKQFAFGILGATILSVGLFACSNDEINETFESNSNNTTLSSRSSNNSLDEVLIKFYGNTITYKIEENHQFDEDQINYLLTKYNIFDNTKDIYTITNIQSNEIIHFIELDKKTKSIKNLDIEVNELITINNIDMITGLARYNYDLIETSKNITLGSGRFWGWSCGKAQYSIERPGGETTCYRTCAYYVLGSAVQGTSSPYPCDDLPGSNPKVEHELTY